MTAGYVKNVDRDFYANYNKTQEHILELADQLKDTYATYYNIKVNKRKESLFRLDEVRKAFRRLYDEIKPKLDKFGNNTIQDMIKDIDKLEIDCIPIPFDKIIRYKNLLIRWIEDSGLTKIDIEKSDLIEEIDKECFGETN
jgi:hypothetical protein